jgi:hypothetical protein
VGPSATLESAALVLLRPARPCITPSTETCAVVVSLMVVVPLSLGRSSFDQTGPRRRSHRSQQSPFGRSIPHPPRTWPASTMSSY